MVLHCCNPLPEESTSLLDIIEIATPFVLGLVGLLITYFGIIQPIKPHVRRSV